MRKLTTTVIALAILAFGAAIALAAPKYDLTGAWTSFANGAPNTDTLSLKMDGNGAISGAGTVSSEAFTLGGSEDADGNITLTLNQDATQFPPSGYTSTNKGTVAEGGNCFSGNWSDTAGHSGTFIWVRNDAAVGGDGSATSPYACASSTSTTSAPLPAPVVGQTVNVMPVSGQVFVKLPASAAAAAFSPPNFLSQVMGPLSKGTGFVALKQARQLPVGTQVDARRGSLMLVSASTQKRVRYTGTFGGGLFEVLQKRAQKGLTTLALKEGLFKGSPTYASCPSTGKGGSAQAAGNSKVSKKVLQTLRSDVKGNFSTRGRYSSATVRGTKWTVTDRCDGTLTTVKRGVVAVRDFARRKTILVRAGHSYLAKAPS